MASVSETAHGAAGGFETSVFSGDVCTHPDFQRQGAAAALMSYIIDEFDAEAARGKGGRIVSTLHAIESMRPFYAKYGYTAVQAHRSLLRMNIGDAGGAACARVSLPTM